MVEMFPPTVMPQGELVIDGKALQEVITGKDFEDSAQGGNLRADSSASGIVKIWAVGN